MSEEIVQENVQESQETKANNDQESPSEPNYKQEMMKYKSQRNEEREENTLLKAEKEKGRQKIMEEQGLLKELVAELKSTNEKQAVKLARADKMEAQLKVDIIKSITSDDKKREELATKDVDTLRFIQNELSSKIVNPQESLGSVRAGNKGDFGGYSSFVEWATKDPKGYEQENGIVGNQGTQFNVGG